MKTIFIGFILIYCVVFSVNAQKYKEMFLHIDSTNFGKTNHFYLDIVRVKKKGKQVLTNLQSSKRDWKDFWVTVPEHLSFNMGICTYDIAKITAENQYCTIKIKDEDSGLEKTISFNLPYVTGVSINSTLLKANRYTTLDYGLIFSNGRTNADNSLLATNQIEVKTSSEKITARGGEMFLYLDQPYHQSTIEIQILNDYTNQVLGSKVMEIDYPSTASYKWNGSSGQSGNSGSYGSSPSGNASNGGHGRDGTDGVSAKILVYEMTVNNETFLILKVFTDDGGQRSEVLRYLGENITIESIGGSGGNGGNGGKGGDGKIDKENNVDSPHAGNGGNGGNGGDAGSGGNIQIYFHENVYRLASKFEVKNFAGMPGTAGEAGKAGKGDYSESKLLGILFSTKGGTDGQPGIAGTYAKDGTFDLIRVEAMDFDALLQRYIEKGYRQ